VSGAHARIAPSSLALTVVCAGSVTMQEQVPPAPPTEEKQEGDAAHLVALWAATGRLLNIGEVFVRDGRQWTVDVDMHNGAKTYVKALGGGHNTLRCEQSVRTSAIHPEHSWGTPDAFRMFLFKEWARAVGEAIAGPFVARGIENVVRVGDYKYGHRFVEVFENWQVMDYGWGVLELLKLSDETTLFEFIIVQPRAYHRDGPVRVWRVHAMQLRALLNIAFNKAHEALGPNPTVATGEHCIDCTARHLCVTYKHLADKLIDFSGSPELQPLDSDAMGSELKLLDAAIQRLEGRRTGLAVAVESTIRAGKRVPFYELSPGRSNLKWRDGVTPDEIAMFGDLCNINVRKPLEVFTPKQCVDAGINETAILQDYAHRPPAGLKLTQVDTTAATKAFAGVTNK
jgi:hypothetical protein